MTGSPGEILSEGETCWRLEHADRAAVLVDGAAYFGALRSALLRAERSIFMVGWDIDSRVRICADQEAPEDGAPAELGALLTHIVTERPALTVHLLLWDYSILYALEREPLPILNLDWATPKQIKVCLDDVLPLGASHHQKIVVIDDAIAFCGGLDLTIRRWDTPAHSVHEPRRVDPAGETYPPFHDVQMLVDGAAAAALAALVRERWRLAACETPLPIDPTPDPWPREAIPDFENVTLGIARTLPALNGRPAVREIEALYVRSIEKAERSIYIENQYVTADAALGALVDRLQMNPDLEVLIVTPQSPHGWLESQAMGAGRARFLEQLKQADVADRVRMAFPCVADGDDEVPVMVHAKVTVIDDVFLRVGSSNLANRSLGLDTECDLAIEARTEAQKDAIARVRNRLISEHLGADPDSFSAATREGEGFLRAVEEASGTARALKPIPPEDISSTQVAQVARAVGDPEAPVDAKSFVGNMFGGLEKPARRAPVAALAMTCAVLVALALTWRFTPLAEFADPGRLGPLFETMTASAWTPVVVPVVYVIGGLILFPVTVMIAVTAMTFGPWAGFAYALTGSLLSAAVGYLVGRAVGREVLANIAGKRVNRIRRALADKGVITVATVRSVPVAPFTLINLVAGALKLRLADYLLGSLLGLAPGIVIMTALGDRLKHMWTNPNGLNIALLLLAVLVWLGVGLGTQLLVSRRRRRHD
ncbi:MAG: VTT domain-containing protein [Alphaproteobacteria bacterium]|nr:VTT domain-containing protein [Alphaproteobacteria bacterium]